MGCVLESGGEHGIAECFFVVEAWRGSDKGKSRDVVMVNARDFWN